MNLIINNDMFWRDSLRLEQSNSGSINLLRFFVVKISDLVVPVVLVVLN